MKSHIPHVFFGGVEKKSCSRCATLLPLSDFYRSRLEWDGLHSACKSCEDHRVPGGTKGVVGSEDSKIRKNKFESRTVE